MAGKKYMFLVFYLFFTRGVYCGCEFTENNSKYACNFRTVKELDDVSVVENEKLAEQGRFRRKASDRSISDLRKRLNDEKIKDELMAGNSTPKLVLNDSSSPQKLRDTMYGGIFTREQEDNKKNDKIRLVHKQQHNTLVDFRAVSDTDCNFEDDCLWTWRKDIANGFFITSARNYNPGETGPMFDANAKDGGSFLLLRAPHAQTEFHVTSPLFGATNPSCRLQVWIYQEQMENAEIRVVIDKLTKHASSINNHTQWVLDHIAGNNDKKWRKYVMSIGKVSENFTIILEVVPAKNHSSNASLAFDNVALVNCYPKNDGTCTAPLQFRCKSNTYCINNTRICDITKDCKEGEDERQNCDQMPYGARCSFEEDMCGWYNDNRVFEWTRHNGTTPTNFTGPSNDHTYMNSSGKYLFANMLTDNVGFASIARLKSIIFNPPPTVHGNASSKYYNSCAIRFYLHQTGKHKSGILLQVTEMKPNYNVSKDISWSYFDHGDRWVRQVFILPNITHRYFLSFDAKRGLRYISDIAIDDVSLSPECFGLNIPAHELNGYNYWNPMGSHMFGRETHRDFVNATYYEINTCGATGRFGPTPSDCLKTYNRTKVKVTVLHDPGLSGMQKWVVPSDGNYSLIAFGAGGGRGSGAMGSSRGAMVRTVFQLRKGQELIFLVGQEGSSACVKTLHHQENSSCWTNHDIPKGIRGVLNMDINDGGGGGGGATYVFMRNKKKYSVPIVIAAGGGGLGLGRFIDTGYQHGQMMNTSKIPVPGTMYGKKSSGAGGGWRPHVGMLEAAYIQTMGRSLLDGGLGGKACYNSTDHKGDGGFGGGGGGCRFGGGGGGYAGGDAPSGNTTNGGGGYSFYEIPRSISYLVEAITGYNAGPGYVMIIPAISGCECDYKCVALDVRRSEVACICPYGWTLGSDGKICIRKLRPGIDVDYFDGEAPGFSEGVNYPTWFVICLIVIVIILAVLFAILCFTLYNRYQIRASGILRKKMLSNTDLQLNRLRMTSNSMMTEYNPNYEFSGNAYTLKDLMDIPREQLRLVKALGQGAFGEVYQGFYRLRPGDTLEVSVAVKTLPELSTSQAEMDFLMEALIMSKFSHPNIVHFIGVCFDKHPRFIVLELLAGGDLKNFLRESRPKPDRGSNLTMKDLMLIALDVAKGCKFLEENRFIHRDLAARNCLLTSKGPGRVVKIADFGMSRDIYRSDYYRKGGKAMLPIKWMPPEAFMDGIFTSKTDVWSFGVVLWEIMAMGYMPYTGCANREVMTLVSNGGRLDPPANCPAPVYGVMTQCWHPEPEMRPTFATILERLGYCAQDPDVMEAPLPVFHRPPSSERDRTVMRPINSRNRCLDMRTKFQSIRQSSDYLEPNNCSIPNSVGSTSSVEKLLPENSDSWETSFIMPHSKSTQPLLTENEQTKEESVPDTVNRLLTLNNASNPKLSPVSLPSNALSNHNNNVKTDGATLKSGLSLDAGALIKQSANQPKYANIPPGNAVTGNGVIKNGPILTPQNNVSNSKSPILLNEKK